MMKRKVEFFSWFTLLVVKRNVHNMIPLTQIIQNSSYVKQELSLTFRLFIKKKNNDICYLFSGVNVSVILYAKL